jgi:hypothetical protein
LIERPLAALRDVRPAYYKEQKHFCRNINSIDLHSEDVGESQASPNFSRTIMSSSARSNTETNENGPPTNDVASTAEVQSAIALADFYHRVDDVSSH